MPNNIVYAEDVTIGQWIRCGDKLIASMYEEPIPYKEVLDVRRFPDGQALAFRLQDAFGEQEVWMCHVLLAVEVNEKAHELLS